MIPLKLDIQESLPRMQEILSYIYSKFIIIRITPAYAGNTTIAVLLTLAVLNHSRVCRKYHKSVKILKRLQESLPRMQEILCNIHDFLNNDRITPAYAGNTRYSLSAAFGVKNHSRVCRKYKTPVSLVIVKKESLPRMQEILPLVI